MAAFDGWEVRPGGGWQDAGPFEVRPTPGRGFVISHRSFSPLQHALKFADSTNRCQMVMIVY